MVVNVGTTTEPRTLLEQKIRERRLTFEEFAEFLEEFSRKNRNVGTLSFRHLQRLIAGRGPNGRPLSPLRPATARLLEEALGVSIERLLGPPELNSSARVPTETDALPTLTDALSAADFRAPSLANLPMFASTVPQDRIVPSTISAIRGMSDAIQMADRRLGGGKLYLTVRQYLRAEIAPYFLDPPGDCSPGELFSASASMTEIAGWMAHDGGNDDRARKHFANAYRLARAGKNAALSANVCASMAHLAIQLGFTNDAEVVSVIGLRHVDEVSGTESLVARLYAMRARAHAIAGREIECRTNLESAHDSLARESGDFEIDWIAGFDEASLASESALCFLALGALSQAERESRKVIQIRAKDRVRSRALAQLTLASVLVRGNKFDEAARVGKELCGFARELNSARVRSGLSKLREHLAFHRDIPDVADFLTIQSETYGSKSPASN